MLSRPGSSSFEGPSFLSVLLFAALGPAARGQDMIAVSYAGAIHAVDSVTGQTTVVGAGAFGHNALARDAGGRLWTVSRNLLGTPVYFLTRIDPDTFAVQAVAPCLDVRALADAGGGELFAIEHFAGNDALSRLDTTTGARTFVGFTGHSIEGLTRYQGSLYAWSTIAGLGTIDEVTGTFTDLGPAGGGPEVRWLAERPDGALIGGGMSFYVLDPSTGQRTQYAQGNVELRGAEATGMALSYGAGCENITLAATGTLRPGSLLTTRSTGYPSTGALVGYAGGLVLGASRTSWQGTPLPLLLDPLLGTDGCYLHVSIDATDIDFTTGGAAPLLFFPIQVPPGFANQTVFLQHMAFDIGGGFWWSNGVQVHIGS